MSDAATIIDIPGLQIERVKRNYGIVSVSKERLFSPWSAERHSPMHCCHGLAWLF